MCDWKDEQINKQTNIFSVEATGKETYYYIVFWLGNKGFAGC